MDTSRRVPLESQERNAGNLDPAKIEARRATLEAYIQALAQASDATRIKGQIQYLGNDGDVF